LLLSVSSRFTLTSAKYAPIRFWHTITYWPGHIRPAWNAPISIPRKIAAAKTPPTKPTPEVWVIGPGPGRSRSRSDVVAGREARAERMRGRGFILPLWGRIVRDATNWCPRLPQGQRETPGRQCLSRMCRNGTRGRRR
jgi:hypothetical protein